MSIDIVIYGATGFSGEQIARYLARKNATAEGKGVTRY
jgi:short subunit dehydrogenase-like uncharacterized protein